MVEEISILGVYMPAALVWATIAALLAYGLRNLLQQLPIYIIVWHPSLLELALFVTLWWGLTVFADRFLVHWMVG